MRLLLLACILACTVLSLPALAHAQPDLGSTLATLVHGEPVRVETTWSMTPSGRRSRVTANFGAQSLVLHDAETVRTSLASEGDLLCVVLIHGGDDGPFARALLLHHHDGQLTLDATVPISRSLSRGPRRQRFPAMALVASTRRGFAILVQDQERDPTADVVSTLSVLAPDGSAVEATHVVAVPWALGALVADGEGYQLAVVWGGGGEGQARLCLVHLSASGAPTEHPWWASPASSVGEIQLLRGADGSTIAAYVDLATGQVLGRRWTAPGHWAGEPPESERLGSLGEDPWILTERAGNIEALEVP